MAKKSKTEKAEATTSDELLDGRISVNQCRLAVQSLHAYAEKQAADADEKELLGAKEQYVWLTVSVKKIPPARRFKPIKIPIVHPIVDPRVSSVCLITKDPQREYKGMLEKHGIKFISRVVGIAKLKGKFAPYEARRMLLKENDLFLADDRVIPLLPRLLGQKWFAAKKQPIPVCLTRKDVKGELERAINSTYMNQNSGTYTSVKVGTMSQTPNQILTNLKKALPAVASGVHGGWDNVQSLGLKTSTSTTLPIWNCNLGDEEGGRWAGLTKGSSDKEGAEDEAAEPSEPEPEPPKTSKGKKRANLQEEEHDVQPTKRAKSSGKEKETDSKGRKQRPDASSFAVPDSKEAASEAKKSATSLKPDKSTSKRQDEKALLDNAPVKNKKTTQDVDTHQPPSADVKLKKSLVEKKKEKLLKSKPSAKKDVKAALIGKKAAKP